MPTTDMQIRPAARLVIGLDELATVLGKKPDYLKRNWLKLHLEHDMPRKCTVGWIWPRALIEAWLVSPKAITAGPVNDNAEGLAPPTNLHADRVAEQNAALRGKYGGGQ